MTSAQASISFGQSAAEMEDPTCKDSCWLGKRDTLQDMDEERRARMVSARHSMDELQRSGALKHIKESAVSKTLTLDDDDEEEEGEVVLKLRDLLSEEMARARAASSSSTSMSKSSSSSMCKGGWFREELRWSWRWKASLVNRSVISDSSVVMTHEGGRERESNPMPENREEEK